MNRVVASLSVLTFIVTLAACSQLAEPEPAKPLPLLTPMAFGTPSEDEARGLAPSSSGVYIVGQTHGDLHSKNLGYTDAFIRKYDRDGKLF